MLKKSTRLQIKFILSYEEAETSGINCIVELVTLYPINICYTYCPNYDMASYNSSSSSSTSFVNHLGTYGREQKKENKMFQQLAIFESLPDFCNHVSHGKMSRNIW